MNDSHPASLIHASDCVNSLLRLAVHGGDFENCSWYVIDIEEKELDTDRDESQAIYFKHQSRDLFGVNCRPKVLKRDGPISFNTQIMWLVVTKKLRGLKVFGTK